MVSGNKGVTQVMSRNKARDAKRDALLHSARSFASTIGDGHGMFAARRELEKAAVEYEIAEREVEAPRDRRGA